ncbi:M15 family metallopeptidase [Nocardioides terrisoli]|uniref:M15 family metallopeptidase n=1 Tax=Nocardioides terrisoli TaxID=3388267 RepID=UPI00287B9F4B|nr:M15 family metallopeptidase [Nocardioides marmorisolisilvae]
MPRLLRLPLVLGLLCVALVTAGCGSAPHQGRDTQPHPSTSAQVSASRAPHRTHRIHRTHRTHRAERTPHRQRSAPGTVPPSWLGTRVLPHQPGGFGRIEPTPKVLRDRRFTLPDTVPMLPGHGFASRIERAPARVLARSTWRPACPVAAADLDWVRLTFRGFDGSRHTGELLVNRTAAADLVRVFHRLWDLRFPLEQMQITTKAEQTAPPTGDGNDTGAFNCRPVRGATIWSEHAYGLAVDVNPFQNPYIKGHLVLPELASAYLDRSWHRPGMILPGGPVVRAFASIGWGWGGSWHSLKDLQHFSANGR